jgi:hypothetical protein
MEAIHSSNTSENYQTTRRHISDNHTLHNVPLYERETSILALNEDLFDPEYGGIMVLGN